MKKFLLAMTMLAIAGSAYAARGASAGQSSAADATLAGNTANAYVWSNGLNPNQYPNGNTAGFSASFAQEAASSQSTWSLVGAAAGNVDSASASISGANLTWGFTKPSTNTSPGTFWIESDKAITLDLTLAVHAANESGAWLFNDLSLAANTALNGSYSIKWVNNGGKVPGFSNVALFARDVSITPVKNIVSPVPEPDTWAMVAASLGVLGFAARRKRAS